ncbi:MAG: extracellular solute-binding protein [Oscillospiraceae bacterium]|nr:extracellular solute-binding protein [Oscillospiraceae bacterium]
MKKLISMLMALVMIVAICAGCGAGGNTPAATPDTPNTPSQGQEQTPGQAEPESGYQVVSDQAFGGAIKYDPTLPVNNGEEITIDYWLWTSDAVWQAVMDEYMAIHPNVHINIINNPWDDYFVKLPVALSGKDGPAMFNMHPSYTDLIINSMAPYDIPLADMQADYSGVDSHIVDGKVHFLDIGYMTGSIFYNADYWAEAGLTDEDIPATWDEFFELAKKLTVKDETGKIVRAGWNCQGYVNSNYIMGLNYQLGQYLFEDDMVTPDINNEANVKIMNMLLDAYNCGEISTLDFTDEALVSFVTGQTAMISSWGWLNDYIPANVPGFNFGVFEIPVFDVDNYHAYNRTNAECTFGINANAPADQQAVAQDIVRFFLANDEAMINVDLAYSCFPSKKCLAENERILSNKALAAIKDHIDEYIYPGALSSTFETNLKIMEQDVFYNGMSVEDALQKCEDAIAADLEMENFVSIENQYVPKH